MGKRKKRQTLYAKALLLSETKTDLYSLFPKKLFSEDMFYQCPNLELVIILRKGDMDNRVAALDNPMRYSEVAKIIVKE